MRRFLVSLVVLALTAAAAGAADFVPGTEDVPLMPGLAAVEGSSLVFDKPEGRIVESTAQGAVSRYDVTRFYAQSLPQLGWRRVGTGTAWRREGETLRLDFHGPDGALTVGFTLSP
jgi:hypothetical protein